MRSAAERSEFVSLGAIAQAFNAAGLLNVTLLLLVLFFGVFGVSACLISIRVTYIVWKIPVPDWIRFRIVKADGPHMELSSGEVGSSVEFPAGELERAERRKTLKARLEDILRERGDEDPPTVPSKT